MLKFALLGLLVERQRHGYELHGALEELFGEAWQVNEGQVYATLSRLERDGLVEHEVVEQEDAPARKVHRTTEAGEKALAAWLESAPTGRRLHGSLQLQVVMQARVDPAALRLRVAEHRRRLLAELADLLAAHGDLDRSTPTALLLDAAAVQVEADLRWLERCEQAIGLG